MSRIRNAGSDEINERQNARRNAEEEIRRLTEKVQSLQAEVYSRQTEKSRVEFNESQAGFRKNDVSVAPINSAYLNVKIKQEMEKYLEGSEDALRNFQKYLSSHKIPSLTVEVLNGKHTLRLRVDQRTTFGDLLKEVRLFWNVPSEKNFVLRDENGNYWSPLSNVIREFSALQHTPKLYFLSKAYPDKKVLEDFEKTLEDFKTSEVNFILSS